MAAYQALLADLHSGPQNMAKALKRLGEKSRFSLAKMRVLPPKMRVLLQDYDHDGKMRIEEGFTIMIYHDHRVTIQK